MCGRFYVGCNMCTEWFHGSCVGVSAEAVHNLSSFICPSCSRKNPKSESEELHCICRMPYDESKYDLCLHVLFLFKVPALALNSRPALKSPWISENWKSPQIVLEKEWKASKSLEFVYCKYTSDRCMWKSLRNMTWSVWSLGTVRTFFCICCEVGRRTA